MVVVLGDAEVCDVLGVASVDLEDLCHAGHFYLAERRGDGVVEAGLQTGARLDLALAIRFWLLDGERGLDLVFLEVGAGEYQFLRACFVLNHHEEVLHEDHQADVRVLDLLDVREALPILFRVLEDVDGVLKSNSKKLDILLEGGGDDFAFFELFGDFEAFDLLQVVRLDYLSGLNADLTNPEVLKNAHYLRVEEEEVDELGAWVLQGHRQEMLLDPFFAKNHVLMRLTHES